jgi:hypothetical protein
MEKGLIMDHVIGLGVLRKPFPEDQVGKLPKPTKQQTDEVKADYKKGIRCETCGQWHHPKVVHLDFVGHAALTNRLLDADIGWTWEPLAFDDMGLPRFDAHGGLWIKLTVCGVIRLGYGNAEASSYKDAGAREKETIGDALRNAAMRFGAALDLWHKGHLSPYKEETDGKEETRTVHKPEGGVSHPTDQARTTSYGTTNRITVTTLENKPAYEYKPKEADPLFKDEEEPKNQAPIGKDMVNALLTKLEMLGKGGTKFYDWMDKTYEVRFPQNLKQWQYEEIMDYLDSLRP